MKPAENSARTAPGRPWPKGTSGNPGGRPREWRAFRDLAREVGSPLAFSVLLRAMRSRNPVAAVRAAQVILAYAWGNPGAVPGVPLDDVPVGGYSLRLEVVGPDGLPRTSGENRTHEDGAGATQREGAATLIPPSAEA